MVDEAASCVGEDGRGCLGRMCHRAGHTADNGAARHVTPPGDSAVGSLSGVSILSMVSIVSTLAQLRTIPGAGIKEAANLGPARATTPSLSAQCSIEERSSGDD